MLSINNTKTNIFSRDNFRINSKKDKFNNKEILNSILLKKNQSSSNNDLPKIERLNFHKKLNILSKNILKVKDKNLKPEIFTIKKRNSNEKINFKQNSPITLSNREYIPKKLENNSYTTINFEKKKKKIKDKIIIMNPAIITDFDKMSYKKEKNESKENNFEKIKKKSNDNFENLKEENNKLINKINYFYNNKLSKDPIKIYNIKKQNIDIDVKKKNTENDINTLVYKKNLIYLILIIFFKEKKKIGSFGYKTKTGIKGIGLNKKFNQDNYIVCPDFCGKEDFYFFGVCDGHGPFGHFVSNFVKINLPSFLSFFIKKFNKFSFHFIFKKNY